MLVFMHADYCSEVVITVIKIPPTEGLTKRAKNVQKNVQKIISGIIWTSSVPVV